MIYNGVPCDDQHGLSVTIDGYAYFYHKRKKVLAHRAAYEQHVGRRIRRGYVVRHACHNRVCREPLHLKEGTRQHNIRDTVRAGRVRNPHTGKLQDTGDRRNRSKKRCHA